MQNRVFQNTCNQLRKDIRRNIGIMDESGMIIACSDESKVGIQNESVALHFAISNEEYVNGGCIFKKIETCNKIIYYVFCEGEDEIARGYSAFLGAHFSTIKQYYDEKYDKNSFIKNIILDNILPSDVLYRTRELRLAADAERVVILIRAHKNIEVSLVGVLQNIFPDSAKDFVIRIDDRDVAVIREVKSDISMKEILKEIKEVYDTIGSEAMAKVSVGVSTIVDSIQDLARAYREARIALEVGKAYISAPDNTLRIVFK